MKHARTSFIRAAAALGFTALLVGCGSSPSTQASSTTTGPLKVQLIASRRAATQLMNACLHGDTPHLLPHVETGLRGAQWENSCKALRDHQTKLVSVKADVHGTTATVRVRLRTHDSHPRDLDETWHFAYHGPGGWQLATMPRVMVGTWDHHDWSSGTTVHHDDHQTGTTTTVHHDDHQAGTSTTVHHDDHPAGTSTTVHHDDHPAGTSTTVHHDDHPAGTSTTVHHDDTEH